MNIALEFHVDAQTVEEGISAGESAKIWPDVLYVRSDGDLLM